MPAPYTDTEQDTLIDQLIADVTALTARVATLEADRDDLQLRLDAAETAASALDERVTTIETVSIPAIDTVQDDVSVLRVSDRNRQENDDTQLSKPQIVTRPAIERVRRPDGRMVQRVVKPR